MLLPKEVTGLPHDSLVLVHQIRTISKGRLEKVVGGIKEKELAEAINNALKIHLNLWFAYLLLSDLPIPPGEYLEEMIGDLGMSKDGLAKRMNRLPSNSALFLRVVTRFRYGAPVGEGGGGAGSLRAEDIERFAKQVGIPPGHIKPSWHNGPRRRLKWESGE